MAADDSPVTSATSAAEMTASRFPASMAALADVMVDAVAEAPRRAITRQIADGSGERPAALSR